MHEKGEEYLMKLTCHHHHHQKKISKHPGVGDLVLVLVSSTFKASQKQMRLSPVGWKELKTFLIKSSMGIVITRTQHQTLSRLHQTEPC